MNEINQSPKMNVRLTYKIAILVFSITLIALTIMSLIYHVNIEKNLINVVENHLKSVATQKTLIVNQLIDKNIDRMALLTSRTELRITLNKLLEERKQGLKPNLAHIEKMRKILVDAEKSMPDFIRLDLSDLDGKTMVTTATNIDSSNEISSFINDKKDNLNFYIKSNNQPKNTLVMSSPLYLNGKKIGFLIVESDLYYFERMIYSHHGLGKTDETILVYKNDKGEILPIVPLKFLPEKGILPPTMDPFNIPKEKYNEIIKYKDYRDQKVLAITKVFPNLNWGMIFKIDVEDVLILLKQQRILLLISFFIAIVIASIIAIIFSRKITKPIIKIAEVAAKHANGDFEERVQHLTRDELGILAKAINEMADKLEKQKELSEDKEDKE